MSQHTPTISEIKARNKANGGYFFSRKNVKAFGSKTAPHVFSGPGGIYFVTSENDAHGVGREHTPRKFNEETAEIRSAYNTGRRWHNESRSTGREAAADARRLAEHGEPEGINLNDVQRATMHKVSSRQQYQKEEASKYAEQLRAELAGSLYGLCWEYRPGHNAEHVKIYELAAPKNFIWA